jgi:hypothetical protein
MENQTSWKLDRLNVSSGLVHLMFKKAVKTILFLIKLSSLAENLDHSETSPDC